MGLAAYKYDKRFGNGGDPLPPLTAIALGEVLGQARANSVESQGFVDNYSLGIALIFLTEVHPTDHMDAIIRLAEEVKKRQKANGAWGYSHEKRGDSSQLQYAALGLWAAKKTANYDISNDVMDRLVNYLIRVQDPSGGWGYQGNDPGGFTRLPQEQVRHSLSAAGLGSLYVAADFLGMSRQRKVKERKSLPPALMPVVEDRAGEGGKLAGTSVDVDRMRAAMNDGNNWFRQNFTTRTNMWQFYYLYGLERYNSFRELVEGTYEEEPRWYNEGVRTLKELQANHGGWGLVMDLGASPVGSDPAVETAFAILFLLRSTRETIETVIERDGVLAGGHDLPSDVSDVRMRNNKIVAPAITGEVADMISMLEDDDAVNIENLLENPDALSLSNITGEGAQFRERLGRVLRNGSYKARIVAVRHLEPTGCPGKRADADLRVDRRGAAGGQGGQRRAAAGQPQVRRVRHVGQSGVGGEGGDGHGLEGLVQVDPAGCGVYSVRASASRASEVRRLTRGRCRVPGCRVFESPFRDRDPRREASFSRRGGGEGPWATT